MKPLNIPINTEEDKKVIMAIIKEALSVTEPKYLGSKSRESAIELYESLKNAK